MVDDGQWLDAASGQVLGFVARRLLAEPVAMVFAVRDSIDERPFAGLPELRLVGLPPEEARALLATVVPGRLDARVGDRIVAETRGNPLALIEFPRGMSAVELAGGFGRPDTGDVPGQIEKHYLERARPLPEETQRLMLLAAAEPVGDAILVWRAAQTLGIDREAAVPAVSEHLLEIGPQVRFRHPLVRSAVYRFGLTADRRAAHNALAAATDPGTDADRRAWHRAQATPGADEDVATELERSAGRAHARGGLAAAAVFLERSADLTADPERRAERMLATAHLHLQSGAFDTARGLLAAAESEAPDELTTARVDLRRGRIASAANAGGEAPLQLLRQPSGSSPWTLGSRARPISTHGVQLCSRVTSPRRVRSLLEVSRAPRAVPRPTHPPGPSDLLLDGLASLITEGRAAAQAGRARLPWGRRRRRAVASVGCSGLVGGGHALGLRGLSGDEHPSDQVRS